MPWLLAGYSALLLALALGHPVGAVIRYEGFRLKLHHIGAFALHVVILGAWLAAPSRPAAHPLASGNRSLALAAALSFLLGAAIETLQLFVPYRSARLGDLVQNATGIALGCLFLVAWRRSPLAHRLDARRARRLAADDSTEP